MWIKLYFDVKSTVPGFPPAKPCVKPSPNQLFCYCSILKFQQSKILLDSLTSFQSYVGNALEGIMPKWFDLRSMKLLFRSAQKIVETIG
jgi:hypothetical protein